MKAKLTDASAMRRLLIEQLKDILWAEKQLVKALATVAKAVKNPELAAVFEIHRGETRNHIMRLNLAFDALGIAPRTKKCEAMAGLLREAKGIREEFAGTPASDTAVVCAAQKIEHYEIASYGSICASAKALGLARLIDLLGETLDEERQAARKLSEFPNGTTNRPASRAPGRASGGRKRASM